MTQSEKSQLRVDFLKTWVSTTLAFIAGEVALLSTVYKDADFLWALYGSILFFMGAIIFWLGAFEGIVTSTTGRPEFQNRFMSWLSRNAPKTDKDVWALSGISGFLFGVGVVLFATFLILS